MSNHIELNSAYPVKVGWRHVVVTEILDFALKLTLVGKVGEDETRLLPLGECLHLDGVDYTLISVHHKVLDPEYPRKNIRHIAGILSVASA